MRPGPLRLGLVFALLCSAGSARAQRDVEIDAQIFTPPPGRSAAITIVEPDLPPQGTLRFGLTSSWARRPLLRQVDCDAPGNAADPSCVRGERDGRTPVLADLASFELAAAWTVLPFVQLGAVVPAHFARVADDLARPQRLYDRLRLGDVRLSLDVPLLRGASALGLSAVVSLPSGAGATLVGARGVTATPTLQFRQRIGRFALSAAAGLRVRERVELLNLELDDELEGALGAAFAFTDRWSVQGELRGRAGVLGETRRRNEHPLEALLAGSYRAGGTTLTLGGGAGVFPGRGGYGAPLVRVLLGLHHELEAAVCRFGPEDYDGFEDDDGCRDPDNDGDGIDDDADACANDPEDHDGFADGDGCPDWDDDADGFEDARDACPRRSEDRDGFADEDGCPEPDNDEDGLPDASDACPADPEDRDGYEDDDGCPEPGPKPLAISVGEQRILVSERIYFDDDRDTIRAVSGPVLDELAQVITGLPPGVVVRVEGHTDDSGNADYNLDLSHRRARAVVEYLKARGVAADRLDFIGYGAARPLAPNDTPEGRALNRRVEFVLLR